MYKIILTGANGQLGKKILELLEAKNLNIYPFSKSNLDVTNKLLLKETFEKLNPDLVINCSAYTKVDDAESSTQLSYSVNTSAVENIAIHSSAVGATLIHFSTDYVFNGLQNTPYLISDQPNPINTYGKSKLLGEQEITRVAKNFLIIRTSWVFSEYDGNFFKTIKDKILLDEDISVVNDQTGCPTYAGEIAKFILFLINNKDKYLDTSREILHFSGKGACTWHGFASYISELLYSSGKIKTKKSILPISTSSLKLMADRPKFSVLDYSQTELKYQYPQPCWKKNLQSILK